MERNYINIGIIVWMIFLVIFIIMFTTTVGALDILNTMLTVIMIGVATIFLMFIAVAIENRLRIDTKVKKAKETIYYREPPFNYSPVIVTYLENLKIEFKKDVIAEIAFLVNKKILKLESIDGKYYIELIDDKYSAETIGLYNVKTQELLWSQVYILSKIHPWGKTELGQLLQKLNKRELTQKYERDCIRMGYLKKGDRIDKLDSKKICITRNISIVFGIISLLMLTYQLVMAEGVFDFETIFSMFFVFPLLPCVVSLAYTVPLITIINAIKTRTPQAKEEYSEWMAFIDFVKEYSLLNKRQLKEVGIWDEYLTYSIAFGITNVNTLLKD